MKYTKTNIRINSLFGYSNILIPAGTRTTHQTAMGIDLSYNFITDFGWIPALMPLFKMDAENYGINIPTRYLTDNLEECNADIEIQL